MKPSNIVDLKTARVLRRGTQRIDEIRKGAKEGLADALRANVVSLNGRELMMLRDNIAAFARILLLTSAEGRAHIERAIKDKQDKARREGRKATRTELDAAARSAARVIIATGQRITFALSKT